MFDGDTQKRILAGTSNFGKRENKVNSQYILTMIVWETYSFSSKERYLGLKSSLLSILGAKTWKHPPLKFSPFWFLKNLAF